MVSEKLIVVLLIVSILLSVGSILITTTLDLDIFGGIFSGYASHSAPDYGGKVQLIVEGPAIA